MKQIILATKNPGKIREFKQMMKKYPFEIRSLLDIAYENEIEETGATFEENALIKAREIAAKYKTTVVADDSGLEIDALDGAPGVYSARYAGATPYASVVDQRDGSVVRSDDANMDKVLAELEGVARENRRARFVCVLVMVDEQGHETVVRGTCEGEIWHRKQGENGFGYDPIFYLPEHELTMAELPEDEKNKLSHRGNALKKLEKVIGRDI